MILSKASKISDKQGCVELERNRVRRWSINVLKTVRAIRATSPKLVPSEPIRARIEILSDLVEVE